MASRRAGSFGAVSLAALTAAGLDEGLAASEDETRSALGTGAEFLGDDWFWLPGERRNRVAALGRRILAVASPLDVATVRAGVVRTYPRSAGGLVPPDGVLAAFFGAHPDFAVDTLGRVGPVAELDYRAELGTTDLIFVEALRASWTGVLDRASFLEACVARGMTARTFALPRAAQRGARRSRAARSGACAGRASARSRRRRCGTRRRSPTTRAPGSESRTTASRRSRSATVSESASSISSPASR